VHFFGVWADPGAALERYHAMAADLHAGRPTRLSTLSHTDPTVKDVCNSFLGWQKDKLDSGEIGARWFADSREIVSEFATAVGKERLATDLRPEDFQRYRLKLAKRLGVHALTRHVTCIRSLFKYAYDVDLINDPVKLGPYRAFRPHGPCRHAPVWILASRSASPKLTLKLPNLPSVHVKLLRPGKRPV
jgi:hypothetical protein